MPDTDAQTTQNPRTLDFSNTKELEAQVVDLISDLRQGKIASNEIIQLATQIKTGAQSGDETVKANARALANHLCAFWATNLRTEDGKSPLYGLIRGCISDEPLEVDQYYDKNGTRTSTPLPTVSVPNLDPNKSLLEQDIALWGLMGQHLSFDDLLGIIKKVQPDRLSDFLNYAQKLGINVPNTPVIQHVLYFLDNNHPLPPTNLSDTPDLSDHILGIWELKGASSVEPMELAEKAFAMINTAASPEEQKQRFKNFYLNLVQAHKLVPEQTKMLESLLPTMEAMYENKFGESLKNTITPEEEKATNHPIVAFLLKILEPLKPFLRWFCGLFGWEVFKEKESNASFGTSLPDFTKGIDLSLDNQLDGFKNQVRNLDVSISPEVFASLWDENGNLKVNDLIKNALKHDNPKGYFTTFANMCMGDDNKKNQLAKTLALMQATFKIPFLKDVQNLLPTQTPSTEDEISAFKTQLLSLLQDQDFIDNLGNLGKLGVEKADEIAKIYSQLSENGKMAIAMSIPAFLEKPVNFGAILSNFQGVEAKDLKLLPIFLDQLGLDKLEGVSYVPLIHEIAHFIDPNHKSQLPTFNGTMDLAEKNYSLKDWTSFLGISFDNGIKHKYQKIENGKTIFDAATFTTDLQNILAYINAGETDEIVKARFDRVYRNFKTASLLPNNIVNMDLNPAFKLLSTAYEARFGEQYTPEPQTALFGKDDNGTLNYEYALKTLIQNPGDFALWVDKVKGQENLSPNQKGQLQIFVLNAERTLGQFGFETSPYFSKIKEELEIANQKVNPDNTNITENQVQLIDAVLSLHSESAKDNNTYNYLNNNVFNANKIPNNAGGLLMTKLPDMSLNGTKKFIENANQTQLQAFYDLLDLMKDQKPEYKKKFDLFKTYIQLKAQGRQINLNTSTTRKMLLKAPWKKGWFGERGTFICEGVGLTETEEYLKGQSNQFIAGIENSFKNAAGVPAIPNTISLACHNIPLRAEFEQAKATQEAGTTVLNNHAEVLPTDPTNLLQGASHEATKSVQATEKNNTNNFSAIPYEKTEEKS